MIYLMDMGIKRLSMLTMLDGNLQCLTFMEDLDTNRYGSIQTSTDIRTGMNAECKWNIGKY